MDYQDAGVNIEVGRSFVDKIRRSVESTYGSGVLGGLGGFGGYFELPTGYKQPVLVSGTDGVGTKLKIAQALNSHQTIGIDLVAMCVNDILTSGAKPLFFLDYLATGELNPQQLSEVVTGIVEGCRLSGCALLGGETAEMPGFYGVGEYDVAGFCVGVVEKSKLLDGAQIQVGDIAIGLGSSGVHSNGFSLVRKIVEVKGFNWGDRFDLLGDKTLGEVLLTPTQIYVQPILEVLESGLEIKGMAHITGGGLPENLPRCLGENQSIKIAPNSWDVLPIFNWIANMGEVETSAMFETFNMGIGFVIIISKNQVEHTMKWLRSKAIYAYEIGEVIEGNGKLIYGEL